jgi:hypothetical protein
MMGKLETAAFYMEVYHNHPTRYNAKSTVCKNAVISKSLYDRG